VIQSPCPNEPGSAASAVRIDFGLEVSRPVGLPKDSEVDHNVAFDIGAGLPFQAHTPYEWRLTIDGERSDDWVVPFYVRTSEL
jgi:hypothetical protein